MKIPPMFMIILLMTIIMIMNKMISWKEKTNKNLNSPFECGFNNMSNHQIPLSHNFFMFNILFLILELEIIIVIPFIFNPSKTSLFQSSFFLIMMLILITMLIERKNKMLEWSK
uniref:NADH-ubiquinone oxidoreductase chain 3 n=1 Tax=Demodex brevis TaxID=574145 RepID=A0A0A7DSY5_DEMBR|nr:NADH dehydrogenase subunit 3 [Demodex brevis]